MGTFRLYTGSDGQSHFETIDLAKTPDWTKGLATTRISFRTDPVGHFIDWHPAPRRQFVITLAGLVEVECGDGTKRRFGAGDIMLADDTTGQGHITREIQAPRKSLFIPLPASLDTKAWKV